MRDYFQSSSPIRFRFPIDGDCLNRSDAVASDAAPTNGGANGDALWIGAVVEAPSGCAIAVCGISAKEDSAGGIYRATVPVSGKRSVLVAENRTDGTSCRVCVFRMPMHDTRHFRISSDDNIRFLQELNDGDYASVFDHPYLAVYKKAHDLYGAKVHLNLFYEFDEIARSYFADMPAYFDLSMMTDRYREEFRANASWLKLAFHARSEFPDAPYKRATKRRITRDYHLVCNEIERFAGRECIPDTTTVHWGEANPACVRALRALGIRSLTGYFELLDGDRPFVSYYAPAELVRHVGARDFWVDTAEDMVFGRIDRVLNVGSLEAVMEGVRAAATDPHRGGFVSIMIHEQYFYTNYKRHLPDFEGRVLLPARYLFEHGYTGAEIEV